MIKKIKKLGLSNHIIVKKGFFNKTLPQINTKYCLALIDCDLEASMTYAAETIWPKLSNNGIILFDEYHSTWYKGSKRAVDWFVIKYQNEIKEHYPMNRLYYVKKKDLFAKK